MALFAAGNEDELFTQGARIRSRLFYKAKVKSLRMTALIVLAFIVCWTPYQVSFPLSCSPFCVSVDPSAIIIPVRRITCIL